MWGNRRVGQTKALADYLEMIKKFYPEAKIIVVTPVKEIVVHGSIREPGAEA